MPELRGQCPFLVRRNTNRTDYICHALMGVQDSVVNDGGDSMKPVFHPCVKAAFYPDMASRDMLYPQ